MSPSKQRVWDVPVRVLHWSLVTLVATAWFTRSDTGPAHTWLGYGAAAVVLARLLWGFVGTPFARFKSFVLPLAAARSYAAGLLQGRAVRYIGHNPLGGWMIIALLANVLLLGLSGWLMSTDWLWGYAWPVLVHEALGYLLLGLVALHIAGVVFTSLHQKENLVRAMFTGEKHKD